MRRLSSEEVKTKRPKEDVLAIWSDHLEIGQTHPDSIHTLVLGKESSGFSPVIFCWGEVSGNKVSNYLIFKNRYNFWIPGQSSEVMSIKVMNKFAASCSNVDSSYFLRLFPIRKNLRKEEIDSLDSFWDHAIESCWKLVRSKLKPHW